MNKSLNINGLSFLLNNGTTFVTFVAS